ncbi:MAG: helix-turn-helix domain-containing protein [bacterium]
MATQPIKDVLSPEEVAARLGLHVRTVRRYIREGRLRATRIGKQYRIAAADFEALVGAERSQAAAPRPARTRRVVVSATTDIHAIGPREGERITAVLGAAFTSQAGRAGARLDCIYYEEQGMLRVVVNGELEFTSAVLGMVAAVLADDEG